MRRRIKQSERRVSVSTTLTPGVFQECEKLRGEKMRSAFYAEVIEDWLKNKKGV